MFTHYLQFGVLQYLQVYNYLQGPTLHEICTETFYLILVISNSKIVTSIEKYIYIFIYIINVKKNIYIYMIVMFNIIHYITINVNIKYDQLIIITL